MARLTVRRGGRRLRLARRLVSLALLLLAAALSLAPDRPAPGISVVALRRDLPAGATVTPGDVTLTLLPRVPDGALRNSADAAGRALTSAARRGEVLTDVRLVSLAGIDPGPGRSAVPVALNSAALPLLGPGMHVCVLDVRDDGTSVVLAADAVVLMLTPAPTAGPVGSAPARVVVFSVPRANADRLATGAVGGTLAVRFT